MTVGDAGCSHRATQPSREALNYIKAGEKAGVHKGYKCRMRKPWWRVPLVVKPDLFFTYMNHERPRLTANDAGVHALNSLYGILLRAGRNTVGRQLLPLACLNSITLLGAEMTGRSYGGGILKIEPKEADKIPVPSLATLKSARHDLIMLRPQLSESLRQNDLNRAVELVDRVLLEEHVGMHKADLQSVRDAREFLFRRRIARGKSNAGEG